MEKNVYFDKMPTTYFKKLFNSRFLEIKKSMQYLIVNMAWHAQNINVITNYLRLKKEVDQNLLHSGKQIHVKANNRKTKIGVVLVSLLLTLNIFHSFF